MKVKFFWMNIITIWLLTLVITVGLLALGVCTAHPVALSYGVGFVVGIIQPLKLVVVTKEEKK